MSFMCSYAINKGMIKAVNLLVEKYKNNEIFLNNLIKKSDKSKLPKWCLKYTQKEKKIPSNFLDPITNELMIEPLILGNIRIDRSTIEKLKKHPETGLYKCPFTRKYFDINTLIVDEVLKEKINKFNKS